MSSIILLGVVAVVVLATIISVNQPPAPPPPQVIYVQPLPVEQGNSGMLPLLIFLGVVLSAIMFG